MRLDIDKLDLAAKALKHLIAEQRSYATKSARAMTISASPKQMRKLSDDMHYQAMAIRQAHQYLWQTIVDAELPMSTAPLLVNPTGWQQYRIETPAPQEKSQ